MSSNIEIQRICEYCKNDFTARTTVTRFCSNLCRKRSGKARRREANIQRSNKETLYKKLQPIELLQAKDILTVPEVAKLLNCSIRSAYNQINNGTIKAVNLGQRLTRVQRSEIDKLFIQTDMETKTPKPEPIQYEVKDCYTITEIQKKFNISDSAVQQLVKRHNIPKMKKGWYAYLPKVIIDDLLT